MLTNSGPVTTFLGIGRMQTGDLFWGDEKAHCFTKRLGIVGVHVAIKSDNEGRIAHYSTYSYMSTLQTNLL